MPLTERDKKANVRVRRVAAEDPKKKYLIGRTGRILFIDHINKSSGTITIRYDKLDGERASIDDFYCDPREFEREYEKKTE